MKKFFNIMLLILCMAGCASGPLKVRPGYIKANVKNVLVIPFYVGDDVLSENLELKIYYTDAERTELKKIINSSKPLFSSAANEILSRGQYQFNIVDYDEKNISFIKKTWIYSPEINYDNQIFHIEKNDIIRLCEKYNVDAVFFHYIQTTKKIRTKFVPLYNGFLEVDIPIRQLEYFASFYDSKGQLLMDVEGSYITSVEEVIYAGNNTASIKYDFIELKKQLFISLKKENIDRDLGLRQLNSGALFPLYKDYEY